MDRCVRLKKIIANYANINGVNSCDYVIKNVPTSQT